MASWGAASSAPTVNCWNCGGDRWWSRLAGLPLPLRRLCWRGDNREAQAEGYATETERGAVADVRQSQIGVPRGGVSARCVPRVTFLEGRGVASGAIGEGVGAAEVLGYFWDAQYFQ